MIRIIILVMLILTVHIIFAADSARDHHTIQMQCEEHRKTVFDEDDFEEQYDSPLSVERTIPSGSYNPEEELSDSDVAAQIVHVAPQLATHKAAIVQAVKVNRRNSPGSVELLMRRLQDSATQSRHSFSTRQLIQQKSDVVQDILLMTLANDATLKEKLAFEKERIRREKQHVEMDKLKLETQAARLEIEKVRLEGEKRILEVSSEKHKQKFRQATIVAVMGLLGTVAGIIGSTIPHNCSP